MKDVLAYRIAPEDRVSLFRKLCYAAATLPQPLFMGTVAGMIVVLYNGVLGISATLVGVVLFFPRIWDAVTDPLVGKWSDACTSRLGRRRPFILYGGILSCITYALLWTPPAALSNMGKAWYLLAVGMVFYTAYTIYSIPYMAMAIELSPDYKERTSVMAVRQLFQGTGDMLHPQMPLLAGVLASLLGYGGDDRVGYGVTGIVFAVFALVLIVVTFAGTKERPAAEVAANMPFRQAVFYTLKNRLFLRLTFAVFMLVLAIMTMGAYVNYLFIYYLDNKALLGAFGMCSGLLGMVLAVFWWYVTNRIGKSRAIVCSQSLILLACLSVLVCFNKSFPYLVFVTAVLMAFGWSGVLVSSAAIMADITDIDELETGKRREGSYGGVYGFIFKLGVAGSTPLLGFGIDLVGFNPELGADQLPATFVRLRLAAALISAFFALVALLILWRFPLTPERALEVRRILEERRGKRGAIQ